MHRLIRRKATVKMETTDRSDILQIKQQVYMEVVFSAVKPIPLEKEQIYNTFRMSNNRANFWGRFAIGKYLLRYTY